MSQSDYIEWGNHLAALQIGSKGWAYRGPVYLELHLSSLFTFSRGDLILGWTSIRFSDIYRPTESHIKNTQHVEIMVVLLKL